jgi:hypothetical protein
VTLPFVEDLDHLDVTARMVDRDSEGFSRCAELVAADRRTKSPVIEPDHLVFPRRAGRHPRRT